MTTTTTTTYLSRLSQNPFPPLRVVVLLRIGDETNFVQTSSLCASSFKARSCCTRRETNKTLREGLGGRRRRRRKPGQKNSTTTDENSKRRRRHVLSRTLHYSLSSRVYVSSKFFRRSISECLCVSSLKARAFRDSIKCGEKRTAFSPKIRCCEQRERRATPTTTTPSERRRIIGISTQRK